MSDKTGIEWTDATWNPVTGCDRTSPGCDNCYALTLAKRLKAMGAPNYQNDGDPRTSGPGFGVTCHPHMLGQPLRWTKPRRIFVNSMSDLFHPDVPAEFIAQVFAVMALAPHHTFQVLTKRPQRMSALLMQSERHDPFVRAREHWVDRIIDGALGVDRLRVNEHDDPFAWPLPNVWLGTSIESDRYAFRADHLRATPAAVRFISAEPLLGPLPSLNLAGIDWLIVGGESGPGARPMHPDWVRDLRDRCPGTLTSATVTRHGEPIVRHPAFFFKQWGAWAPIDDDLGGTFGRWVDPNGSTYGNPGTLAAGRELMSHFGKRAAGRALDGRTWDEHPEAAS